MDDWKDKDLGTALRLSVLFQTCNQYKSPDFALPSGQGRAKEKIMYSGQGRAGHRAKKFAL